MNNDKSVLHFEEDLWKAADKLRSNMDAAEYKNVVLGLIFLKYISDAFEEKYNELKNKEKDGYNPEDKDEYISANIFWVPKEARWSNLIANAKSPKIGNIIDSAMDAIEKINPPLKGVLTKDYAKQSLDKKRLGELIDLIANIGLGDKENRSKDILGRVYEYFLGKFALSEGKSGGQFYTPRPIVQLLVEMIEPYHGRIYDPCCGSGGMFVQSEKFVEEHGGKIGDVSIYGQESNQTTWKLCMMNLAIRHIEANIQWNSQGTFHNDAHQDLLADFILANPPFNDSDWGGETLRDDKRWEYGPPSVGNANFAWVQHFIHHLKPNGIAGFVLSNGSLSSEGPSEGDVRANIVEKDLVDCIVSLPGQLFYSTQIPACLWFVSRNKKDPKFRNRKDETLFIDARNLGHLVDRIHLELSNEEINLISNTYRTWKSKNGKYRDVPGFCKSVKIEEIRKNNHILSPGRYVELEEEVEDHDQLKTKLDTLFVKLEEELKQSKKLDQDLTKSRSKLEF